MMIAFQHTSKFLNQPVREFFCPEVKAGRLSFNNHIAYHAQDLCRAAGIVTIDDLKKKSEADLRLVSFSTDVLNFIRGRLAEKGLHLNAEEGFLAEFARRAHGGAPEAPTIDRNVYLEHFGAKLPGAACE